MNHSPFSPREQERYQRHMQLPGFSEQGQAQLKKSHVLIIGMGGLGCPAAQYLAAAGIGKLTLVDGDEVSLSNLQRQILFSETDIGHPKARVAQHKLNQLNSDIQITAITEHLTLDNAPTLIDAANIVIDCTDNFHTRYLINDLCSHLNTPWVYSSVLGFNGQLALFDPGRSCFRCLFPTLSEVPDCNQAGVLGVIPGTLGTLQAQEAIKYLTNLGPYAKDERANKLYQLSALELGLRGIQLGRSPECPLCSGASSYLDHTADYQAQCSALPQEYQLPADQLNDYLEQGATLIDVRSPEEHAQGSLGGINIPLETLKERHKLDDKDSGCYLIYCQSGIRSQQAVKWLLDKTEGSLKIKSLQGGIDGQS